MATDKKLAPNIDNSEPGIYPNGRIKDNTGAGDGTPVNRLLYSDLHEFFAKLMRLANIAYNGLPDNEANGFQLVSALIALAGKNDYIYNLSSVGGVINISTDISIVNAGEVLLTKAGFNFATESNIKGTTPSSYGVSVPSAFKNNDYLLLIKNGSTFTLHRLADGNNIDAMVAENNYLKAADIADEFAGLSSAKATTPYTNQLAFTRRVIGLDSGLFLATALRNGLMSKEDKALLDSLINPVKNVGWFSGVSPGSGTVGTLAPRYGNVVSAELIKVNYAPNNSSNTYLVTLENPMIGTNYFVRTAIQSEGTLELDNDIAGNVFRVISNTQFQWAITDKLDSTKNLKINLEVVQL